MEYAISIKNLTKQFGSFTAVDNVSFDIPKGKIFGFLGPNGSGKSTTVRMICGVLRPTSGEGKVLGYNLVKESENIKQNIGYMSQKFSLYEDLTVEENLDFYGDIYMLSKDTLEKRKKELIQMANLQGKEKSLAGTLSGGWKQRLALGCSLIHNPSLLILDEPTAGVDPVSRREFWHTITNLVTEGMTVLVTTHYMDEASVCDIIGFIYNSKLITIDTPSNLYAQHKTDNLEDIFINYVKELSNKEIISSFNDLKLSKDRGEG
ncbi:ABC transporter ATP-binding protein [Clostridium sp. DJ247]|uniref:ABC transporter ATP-binding protein n=1 Tax=Clostridium sp. DJ247 TaxID=2726188 RepID=UPI0016235D16|nr:ABC transporter ATP-binding protein [Clostridium sp. DJ247]MBC2579792.1 ABC transporter ATP-binding protein [Clostridium sp. DJ247]